LKHGQQTKDQIRKPGFGRKLHRLCETANSVHCFQIIRFTFGWRATPFVKSAKQYSPNLKHFKSYVLLGMLYLLFKQWLVIFCTLKQDVRELQRELMMNDAVIIKGM